MAGISGSVIVLDPKRSQEEQIEEARRKAGVMDPVTRLMKDPANRGMTVDDMREREVDNLHLLLHCKGMKAYQFDTFKEAMYFHGQALAKCLDKLGCKALARHGRARKPKKLNPFQKKRMEKRIDEEMIENDVRVESRESRHYPKEIDAYKRGFYIYHGNEIVYFISSPNVIIGRARRLSLAIRRKYLGGTNAPENYNGP